MIELKNIKKDYPIGGGAVHALKGISLRFRDAEFVSILGPSGCGKTTLLNIIGGLDRYTSGDLIINGRSTKDYKERDFDAYRNHSVGFVFQNYNLIPHQTVLANVELALTLSGVPKKERRERARAALDTVGLSEHINKRPNLLSGGQMQRVAIARALVNNPDIILADEPTGALDTETGIQVMDLLKKVSESHLVVMVTHNPDLAEKYSSRIINMLDGLITSDSAPVKDFARRRVRRGVRAGAEALSSMRRAERARRLTMTDNDFFAEEEIAAAQVGSPQKLEGNSAPSGGMAIALNSAPVEAEVFRRRETPSSGRKKMPSMSPATSFGLSLRNLLSKKGRTILTAFAGSIGIIGISLILAVSQGTNDYIAKVQEDTLASYPVTLESSSIDLASLMATFMGVVSEDSDSGDDAVYEKASTYNMVNALNNLDETQNDLKAFKEYLEGRLSDEDDALTQAVNGVQYGYLAAPLIYTENVDGNIIKADTTELLSELISEHMGFDMTQITGASGSSAMTSMMSEMSSNFLNRGSELWQELLPGVEYVLEYNDVADASTKKESEDGGSDDGETLNDGAADKNNSSDALINDLILDQYDVVYGKWPSAYNEIVLVLDKNNEMDDTALYALGLISKDEMDMIMDSAVNGTPLDDESVGATSWSYEEICEREYTVILNGDCYVYNEETGLYEDLRDSETGLKYLYDNGIKLKVSGIIRPKEDADTTVISASICYTAGLTEYIIEHNKGSEAISAQLEDVSTDIFTGLPFSENSGSLTDAEKAEYFRDYAASFIADAGEAANLSDDEAEYYKEYTKQLKENVADAVAAGLKSMNAGAAGDASGTANYDEAALYSSGAAGDEDALYSGGTADYDEAALYANGTGNDAAAYAGYDTDTAAAANAGYDAYAGISDDTAANTYADASLYDEIEENAAAAAADDAAALSLDEESAVRELSNLYTKILSTPDEAWLDDQTDTYMEDLTREDMENMIESAMEAEISVGSEEILEYIKEMPDGDLTELFAQMIKTQIETIFAAQMEAQLDAMTELQKAGALVSVMNDYLAEDLAFYYDNVLEFSSTSYDENLETLGYMDLNDPAQIDIYATSFENKDVITDAIADYNAGVTDELKKITYTDYIGIMMSSITTIINAITYILIAFVAISLIVSSIMIGVITLISVQERTREIGILRSIGASRKNVSGMFNAETVIIGFISGLVGCGVTYLLCIPINIILRALTGISSLGAVLPIKYAGLLVLISILLTLIAGIIPSRGAAKKDPAVALRTE